MATEQETLPILRNSERSSFKTCQYQWNWAWNMGLELALPRHDARWFGSAWHVVWANYYTPPMNNGKRASGFTRGVDPHETWEEQMKSAFKSLVAQGEFNPDLEADWVEAKPLGHAMIDGQLKEWNSDPAWEVLGPEMRFSMKIPYNPRQIERLGPSDWAQAVNPLLPGGRYITRLAGSMDLPIRNHNWTIPRIEVVDWKSAAAYDPVSSWLVKDDQVGTYLLAATTWLRKIGKITDKEACTGGIWSYARKQMPPDPATLDPEGRKRNKPQKKHFQEALTTAGFGDLLNGKETLPQLQTLADRARLKVWGDVSKAQPQKLFWRVDVERGQHNRERQRERVADDAEQIALARGGLLGLTKAPGKHCGWCDFKDLCDIDENGGDTEQFIQDVFRVRDVYADHRQGADNSKVTTK